MNNRRRSKTEGGEREERKIGKYNRFRTERRNRTCNGIKLEGTPLQLLAKEIEESTANGTTLGQISLRPTFASPAHP